MKHRSTILLFALCFVALAAPALAQSESARITGQVLGEDGQPVAGLTIRFSATAGSSAPGFEVTTNKKGKFTYPAAKPGTFEAIVEDGWWISKIGMKHLGATVASGAGFETELMPGEPTPPMSWLPQSQIRLSMTVAEGGQAAGQADAGFAALEDASPILTELNELFEAEDWAVLIERSAAVLAENPELGGAHYLRGVALLRTERAEEAVTAMRAAAEYMPEQPGIHGTLGMILLTYADDLRGRGEEDAALETYGEAADLIERQLEETPDSVVYLMNRVVSLDRAGDTDRLQSALEELLLVDQSDPKVTLRLAELHIEQGRVDEAMDLMSGLEGSKDVVATLIYNAAVEMWNAGDLELTISTIDKGLKLVPEMAELYRVKAMALIGSDQPQSIELLEKYLSMVSDDTPGIEADRQLVQALKDRQ